MTGPIPWVDRVQITNYKSIATADVSLGPLTVLVGPNGSGKSNFLDALSFLGEAVATSPYQAVESRGGLGEILRRVPDQAESFQISVQVTVPWGLARTQQARGSYGFEIGRSDRRGRRPIEVLREWCQLSHGGVSTEFRTRRGHITGTEMLGTDQIEPERLYLPVTSGLPNYAPLFGLLSNMSFYNLDPRTLRSPATEAERTKLGPLGEHLADVIGQLYDDRPEAKSRFDDYLGAIVPGLNGLDRMYAGSYVTVEMRQNDAAFGPAAMSDGTIRAAGVLAALFQPWVRSGLISLVGIEEPEVALHPAAAGVLFDALSEASETVQVLATSQSAELLDRPDAKPEMVRVVTARNGLTVIGELDQASQTIVDHQHFTVGELLRADQLQPAPPAGDTEAA